MIGRVLRQITIPEDATAIGDQFVLVRILIRGQWQPALLVAWVRLPDGWACTLRTPRYRAPRGWLTRDATYRYDPAMIQPLTSADIRPDSTPDSTPGGATEG